MKDRTMKAIYTVLFTLLLFSTVLCKRSKISEEPFSDTFPLVNTVEIDKKITDTVELELSQISKNLQIVKLETCAAALLGNIYTLIVGDNYIIIGTERDFYLFNRKGKYIRRLLIIGRGPEEFILPQFSKVIRNDIIYIFDSQKNRNFIYSIDLNTGKQSKILRANEGLIMRLIPDSDTTLIIISVKASMDYSSSRMWSTESTLIKQNLKGTLLHEVKLGNQKGFGSFPPPSYSMYSKNETIIIASPRCDSILMLSDFKLVPIWRNTYRTNYNESLFEQSVPSVNFINYSRDTLLFWISSTLYKGNRSYGGKGHFLLMDRVNNKLIAIKRLYLYDKSEPINLSRINLLEKDQFAMAINALDGNKMLKTSSLMKSIIKTLMPDSSIVAEKTSAFDNPYILIGKFR